MSDTNKPVVKLPPIDNVTRMNTFLSNFYYADLNNLFKLTFQKSRWCPAATTAYSNPRGAPRSRIKEDTIMKNYTRRELFGRLVPGAAVGFLAVLTFLARDAQANGRKKKTKAKRKVKGQHD